MRGGTATRLPIRNLVVLAAACWLPSTAAAFEAFDGRLQAHGFFESQLRTINADFSEDWDVTQWYNIFNLEVELDIIEDRTLGIDLMSAFVRIETRFDCIYSRGCGMFRSMNAYGDRSKSLPRRLNNAEETVVVGDQFIKNKGRLSGGNTDPVDWQLVNGLKNVVDTEPQTIYWDPPPRPPTNPFTQSPPKNGDECFPRRDGLTHCLVGPRPYEVVFEESLDFRFTQISNRGGSNGGNAIKILGPWLPKNWINPIAATADKENPFDTTSVTGILWEWDRTTPNLPPTLTGKSKGALPYRPIPVADAGDVNVWDSEARGLFLPSTGLRNVLDSGRLNSFPFNFSQSERAWNRGSSQQDNKELKEAYLDVEVLDSRLWMRFGLQSIVWGKTELFRTTDQFNPVDRALASLPSLEESRIALWAARGVYSFYEVGPFDDFRVELAFNFDDYEPADLGACGEPYTFNLVCQLTMGAVAHGFGGFGVAGVDRPPDPWSSLSGWEIGGRVEWRWSRFSFALSDFWGYNDLPTVERVSTYERNVDPNTGRPRRMGWYGPCGVQDPISRRPDANPPPGVDPLPPDFDNLSPEWAAALAPLSDPSCLRVGPTHRETDTDVEDPTPSSIAWDIPKDKDNTSRWVDNTYRSSLVGNALDEHFANQTFFAWLCSNTIGFNNLDATACAQTIFNSQERASDIAVIPIVIGSLLAGGSIYNNLITLKSSAINPFTGLPTETPLLPFSIPVVALSRENARDPDNPAVLSVDRSYGCKDPRTGGTDTPRRAEFIPCGDGSFPDAGAIARVFTPEQEALLGCGPFFGTDCDYSGIDLLNAEASALLQSFVGATGTSAALGQLESDLRAQGYSGLADDVEEQGYRSDGWKSKLPLFSNIEPAMLPGTLRFELAEMNGSRIAGPKCTTADFQRHEAADSNRILPGCRRKWNDLARTELNPEWKEWQDGNPDALGVLGNFNAENLRFPRLTGSAGAAQPGFRCLGCVPVEFSQDVGGAPSPPRGHAFSGELYASEMAGLSWNFLMLLVGFDSDFQKVLLEVHRAVLRGRAPLCLHGRRVRDAQPEARERQLGRGGRGPGQQAAGLDRGHEHPVQALQLRDAPELRADPEHLQRGGAEEPHDCGRRRRHLRAAQLCVAERRRGAAHLRQAQRPGLLDGLRRGLHQVQFRRRVHLDQQRAHGRLCRARRAQQGR